MLESVLSAYEGLKAALGIVQSLNATNTQVQLNEAKIPLQQYILDAQMALASANEAQAASAKRVAELEQQIVTMKNWDREKERYQLQRYAPGSFAYALKPGMEQGEPPHRLCTRCYQQSEKSFLQATGKMEAGYRVHRCPTCKNEAPMYHEPVQPEA